MAVTDNTKLRSVSSFAAPYLMNELETNMKIFFDWGFLGIGGWSDATIPTTGAFGGDLHVLKPVYDPSYTDGQVWQAFRKDWVWETGVQYLDSTTNPEPINITGVRIDGNFYGSGDASYGWHINYPLGRVVFDSAQPLTSTVDLNYSYRFVQIYRADDADWWTELQHESFRADNSHFSQFGTGDWSVGAHHRVQMPAIVLETVSRGESRGYELGNGALAVEQDILFHVLAENRFDRNNLVDIIRLQHDSVIWLFNSQSAAEATGYPLDYRGMLVGTNMYPDLVGVSGYRWQECRFTDSVIAEVESLNPNLHQGTVRATVEVIIGNI